LLQFLGDRIQNAREHKGMSSKEAANLCNVTKSTWSLYESNDRKPSIDNLKIISEKLDISADYLLGLKKDMSIIKED